MSSYTLAKAACQGVVELAHEAGLRVFLSKSETYGIVTDDEGTKVLSFSGELTLKLSGNYITDNPAQTGTGWVIEDNFSGGHNELLEVFSSMSAPHWAVGGTKWRLTTLEEYLRTYQPSSRFSEVRPDAISPPL